MVVRTGALMLSGVRELGFRASGFLADLGHFGVFSGAIARALLLPPPRLREWITELYTLGVLSVSIIVVAGLAVGMVLGLQGYSILARFGAADSLLAAAEAGHPNWLERIVLRGQIPYRRSRLAWEVDLALAPIATAAGHADRALAIDPNDAVAHELRGTAQYFHYILNVTPDPKEAAALLQKVKDTKDNRTFIKPNLTEIQAYCSERKNNVDSEKFFNHYESNGWKVGKNKMKDWKACVRTWEKSEFNKPVTPIKKTVEEGNVW